MSKKNIKTEVSNSKKNIAKKNVLESKVFQLCFIVFLVLIIYAPTLKYEYVSLDDTSLIVDKFKFNKQASNIPKVFAQQVFFVPGEYNMDCVVHPKEEKKTTGYYRPILSLSFMLDAMISNSPMPKFYRFSNIVYHIICCVLLLTVFSLIGFSSILAFCLTLIFAAHPLLAHAVVWIPGRNDSLLTIFVLASFIYFLKSLSLPSLKNYGLHFLFFLLACLTKETAFLLPIICFSYLLFFDRSKIFVKNNLLHVGFYLASVFLVFSMNVHTMGGMSGFSIQDLLKMGTEYLYNIPVGLLQFFGKLVMPFNLSVLPTLADTNYFLVAASIILVAAGIYFSRNRKWNYILFGAIWFIVFLLPALFVAGKDLHEHRAYLPEIGFLISIGGISGLSINIYDKKFYLSLISIIAIFYFVQLSNLPLYQNRFNFWGNSITTANNASAAYNSMSLGKLYEQTEQYDKAIEVYNAGLERKQNQLMLNNNLGGAYMYKGMFTEAEIALKKEIALSPDNCCAYYNIGLIRKFTNHADSSVFYWKKALEVNKDFASAYQELAVYYKNKKDTANYSWCAYEMQKRKLPVP